jgi:uncharacterized membrane-anchored protein YhcB (DUF1043 family)
MDTFGLIVLVVTLLVSFGVLIGFTVSELLIGARTRRQAAVQRSLNEQWQEIDAQWKEIEAVRQSIAQRTDERRKPVRC